LLLKRNYKRLESRNDIIVLLTKALLELISYYNMFDISAIVNKKLLWVGVEPQTPWLQNTRNKKTCLLYSHKSQLHRFLYSLTDSFIVPSLLFLHYSISSNPHLHPYQGLRFDLKPRRRTLNRYTLVQSQSTSKPRSFVSAQHLHLRQTLNLVILSILGTEIVTVTTLMSPHFLYFT
jgi:hypothetical protein